MDIHILHNGDQLGPFTEDAVQTQLNEGRVLISDPAWRPGMDDWIPLGQVLNPTAGAEAPGVTDAAANAEPPAASRGEPATDRQKAFLAFMGESFAPDVTREAAARLVNDTMENPRDPARLGRWNEERLQLHPELFAAEIQARKENRAQRFFEICESEGAGLFEKVTKAHCQVLVGHLDVRSPGWDVDERVAARKYFFPALAEKFPQLVTDEGREKLKLHEKGQTVDRRESSSSGAAEAGAWSSSITRKLFAVARGVAIGLAILGVLWFGRGLIGKKPAPVAVNVRPKTTAEATSAPSVNEPAAPAQPAPAETADAKPKMEEPAAPAPSAASANSNPAPPPAASASDLPTKTDAPNMEPTNGLIAPSPARSTVILTKPIQVTLAYGKVTVPPGTPVAIVQKRDATLTVRYLDKVIDIPAASTDLGTDPAATPAPAPQ